MDSYTVQVTELIWVLKDKLLLKMIPIFLADFIGRGGGVEPSLDQAPNQPWFGLDPNRRISVFSGLHCSWDCSHAIRIGSFLGFIFKPTLRATFCQEKIIFLVILKKKSISFDMYVLVECMISCLFSNTSWVGTLYCTWNVKMLT